MIYRRFALRCVYWTGLALIPATIVPHQSPMTRYSSTIVFCDDKFWKARPFTVNPRIYENYDEFVQQSVFVAREAVKQYQNSLQLMQSLKFVEIVGIAAAIGCGVSGALWWWGWNVPAIIVAGPAAAGLLLIGAGASYIIWNEAIAWKTVAAAGKRIQPRYEVCCSHKPIDKRGIDSLHYEMVEEIIRNLGV